MEIRTTREIRCDLILWNPDIKEYEIIKPNKKWVALDYLFKWIDEINDETAFNQWQIRKTTIEKVLNKKP